MPVPVGSMPQGARGPSTLDKLKMGGMMGGSVGLIIGFIFGFTNIVRFGPGPNGMLRTLGQYMMGSAATFGFFMAIGTTIRTESSPIATKAFARINRTPTILHRHHQSLRDSRGERN
ncbi:reactive mitochondrial oxygen species modulator 1-domain-containing protein [Ampelomyces quisqualis]|uniref:Reactive mitochondrial oxygen species modulator 1-domain-containing protein n=1 Tax=Ampelomyces quisqualis TaxID=50730 RepID=A0A6A5QDK3_AMPQU|nr:reactive mitochondrial oxygen species modulator 1-domain-containing protein [Ampelomyces quisqualis]